jgi:hypothetical protein
MEESIDGLFDSMFIEDMMSMELESLKCLNVL